MKSKDNYYILDTSALLFDPSSLTFFKDNNVIIPISVLQELDHNKDRMDEAGRNAREVNRTLNDLKKLGSLSKGVMCPKSNVKIFIFAENLEDVPESLDRSVVDDRILSVCLTLVKSKGITAKKVHLVTNDFNLGLKASAYGIDSFDYQPKGKYQKTSYMGHREIEETNKIVINKIYENGSVPCPKSLKAFENEYFLIKNKTTKQSARCIHKDGYLYKMKSDSRCYHIKPLNNEQAYALDLLLDPEIKLVTLTGLAGSGKSLLSVASGLLQVIENDSIYEKLMLSRSLVVLSGKDKLGYLKGGIKEKLAPYLLPLNDAVDQVLGEDSGGLEYLSTAQEGKDGKKVSKPKIEIEPLMYIRGRSLRDVFFIIDEAQNLTLTEVKTIISRAGEGTKVVLLGDTHQIDNPYLSKQTNGLAQVVERFKDSKIAGHVGLVKGVRSVLATEAANRL